MRRRTRKNTRRGWSTKKIIMKNWTQTLGKCKRNFLVLWEGKVCLRLRDRNGSENWGSFTLSLRLERVGKLGHFHFKLSAMTYIAFHVATLTHFIPRTSFQALKLVKQVKEKLSSQQVLSSNANAIERRYRPENWYMVILFCCLLPSFICGGLWSFTVRNGAKGGETWGEEEKEEVS